MAGLFKKDCAITLRCSASLQGRIDELAKSANCSRSSLVRWCLMEGMSIEAKVNGNRDVMDLEVALKTCGAQGMRHVK